MLAPQVQFGQVEVQDRLVLDAAEHCRQLRLALSEKQRSPIRAVKQRQRQLHEEEQRQLLREQQKLLED